MDEGIVVVSMLRGDCVPARPDGGYLHPASPLWASPEMMRPGAVGLQQCFVTGEVFRRAEFDLAWPEICDGLVGEWLAVEFGDSIRYEPELFVEFNRLEPGRWAVDHGEGGSWR